MSLIDELRNEKIKALKIGADELLVKRKEAERLHSKIISEFEKNSLTYTEYKDKCLQSGVWPISDVLRSYDDRLTAYEQQIRFLKTGNAQKAAFRMPSIPNISDTNLIPDKNQLKFLVPVMLAVMLLIGFGVVTLKPGITGLVIFQGTHEETIPVKESFFMDSEKFFSLDREGKLRSLRISGTLDGTGTAKVYLVDDSNKAKVKRYLVYDSEEKKDGAFKAVTGLVTGNTGSVNSEGREAYFDNQIAIDEAVPKTAEKITIESVDSDIKNTDKTTSEDDNKKDISFSLVYSDKNKWDEDNDGLEKTTGVVDLGIEDIKFNWDISDDEKKNLCTVWEVSSEDEDSSESRQLCHGRDLCCDQIGAQFLPDREWNQDFFSYFGLYGAGYKNSISAQIFLLDDNTKNYVASEKKTLPVEFEQEVNIKKILSEKCVDTCRTSIDTKELHLVFELDNVTLFLDNITYSFKFENHAPEYISNVTNLTTEQGVPITIDMDDFFYDIDGDTLNYSTTVSSNLDMVFDGAMLTITPRPDFVGTEFFALMASDGIRLSAGEPIRLDVIIGNLTVNLTTNLTINESLNKTIFDAIQHKAEVGKPVKWTKQFSQINNESSPQEINVSTIVHKNAENIVLKPVDRVETKNEIRVKEFTDAKIAEFTDELMPSEEKSYELEYETESPVIIEKYSSDNKKIITVSSETHYTNVLAKTTLPQNIKTTNGWQVRLFSIGSNARSEKSEISRELVDSDSDGYYDTVSWTAPHLSNETFEISIIVLNVQSYPTVGGNWVVEFNTTGNAPLLINAINETSYGYSAPDDLEPLTLECGEENVNFTWYENTSSVGEYNCDSTGKWTVRVNTEGVHIQEFIFGGEKAYGFNLASFQTYSFEAFEGLGVPSSPFNTSLGAANITELQYINVSDDVRFITSNASAEGDIDTQVFIFNLTGQVAYPDSVTKLNLTWEGYGDENAGYWTNISIWNWTRSAWTVLNYTDFGSAADTYKDIVITNNPIDYVNSTTKQVAVMISTTKKVSAAVCGNAVLEGSECCDASRVSPCEMNSAYYYSSYVGTPSCSGVGCKTDCTSAISFMACHGGGSPFIYLISNNIYTKLSDFIPTATSKDLEYESYTPLPQEIMDNGASSDNNILFKITEELDETTYLDSYKLVVHDYPLERKLDYNDWLENNFESMNYNNLKKKVGVEVPSFVSEKIISANNQESSTLISDDKYLMMLRGYQKELKFSLPNVKKKEERNIYFVAEGYYLEHYKEKQLAEENKQNKENHRSLNTDLIRLGVTHDEISNCTNITSAGRYILNSNISDSGNSYCIYNTVSNVIVDCKDNIIDGIDALNTYGIYGSGRDSNMTIQNCKMTDWHYGILMNTFNRSLIQNINSSSNTNMGLYLLSGDNIKVENVYTSNGSYGMYFQGSGNNNISNSVFESNLYNFRSVTSYSNKFENNSFRKASTSIYFDSSYWNKFINNTITDFTYMGFRFYGGHGINITKNKIIEKTSTGYYPFYIYDNDFNESYIWDNIINSTSKNYYRAAGTYNNYMDLGMIVPGKNIIGGDLIGGNFWANSTTSTGWSQTYCTDTDGNGICENPRIFGVNVTTNETDDFVLGYANYDPKIFWNTGTPNDAQTLSVPNVVLNITSNDSLGASTFIEFNNDLVGYWSFDYYNTSGIYDNSSNRFHANYSNGIDTNNLSIMKYGYGTNFDGQDDYLHVGDITKLDNTTAMSIVSWVQVRDSGVNNILNKGGNNAVNRGFQLYAEGGVLRFNIVANHTRIVAATADSSITTDTWHHIAALYNGTHIYMFIDGNPSGTPVIANDSINDNEYPLEIGRWYQGTSGYYLNGSLDELAIFNRTLSWPEINATMNFTADALQINFSNIPDDTYSYKAYSIDENGHINISIARSVTIGTTGYRFTDQTVGQKYALLSSTTTFLNETLQSGEQLVLAGTGEDNYWIGLLYVDFGENINMSQVYMDYNLSLGKAFIHNATNVSGVLNASLLIPKSGSSDGVYICPNASALSAVNLSCPGKILLNSGQSNSGMSLGTTTIDEVNYWIIYNISGTGAGDNSIPLIEFKQTMKEGLVTNLRYPSINVSINSSVDAIGFLDIKNSLLGYWSFEYYNSTQVFDNSSYTHNANFAGGMTSTNNITEGRFGYGANFNGASSYLSVPYSHNLNLTRADNFTFIAWIKPVGWGTSSRSILFEDSTTQDGVTIWNAGSQMAFFGSESYNIPSITQIPLNTWTHIALVYEYNGTNSTYTLYQNGNLDLNKASGSGRIAIQNALLFGGTGSSRYFNGTLDEIMIFNRSLTWAEINSTLNATKYNLFYNSSQPDSSQGLYEYSAFATNTLGNVNKSLTRSLFFDYYNPTFTWVNPTPSSSSIVQQNSVILNATTSDLMQSSAFIDFNNDLVAYWSFDYYNSTHIFDNSSHGFHLNFSGDSGPENITYGKYGKAINMSRHNNYYIQPVNQDGSFDIGVDPYTIMFWFKSVVTGAFQVPIYKGATGNASPGYDFEINGAGLFYANVKDIDGDNLVQTVDAFGSLADNNWHHAAFVIDRNGVYGTPNRSYLIVDGTIGTASDISNVKNISSTVQVLYFGKSTSTSYPLNGSLDEIYFVRRALTWREINATMNNSKYMLQANMSNLVYGTTNNYTAYVNDEAGNMNKSEVRFVTYLNDTTRPNISWIYQTPEPGATHNDSNAVLNATITDNSGITSAFFDFSQDVLGYWNFEYYNSTQIFDNSTYKRHANFSNNLDVGNITDGKFGKGLLFDGIGTYLGFRTDDGPVNGNSAFSVSLWIKSNGTGTYQKFINQRDEQTAGEWEIFLYPNGLPTYYDYNDALGLNFTANTTVIDNNWHHLVLVRNSSEATFYVDGIKENTIGGTGVTLSSSRDLWIGRDMRAVSYPFNGTLDEIVIIGRALTSNEVLGLYNMSNLNNQLWTTFEGLINDVNYNYSAYAIDSSGNLNISTRRNFTVSIGDTTPPSITWVSPTPEITQTTTNSAYLNASISDNSLGTTSALFDFNRSLRGYYTFDYASPTNNLIYDNSTYGAHATYGGGTHSGGVFGYWGVIEQMLTVSEERPFDLSENLTIMAWIYPITLNDNYHYIFEKKAAYGLFIDSAQNRLGFYSSGKGNSYSADNVISAQGWQHVAVVVDHNTDLQFYINGTKITLNKNIGRFNLDDNFPTIGGYYNGSYIFGGGIDELSIHARVLSDWEINASINNSIYQLQNNFTGLYANWSYNYSAYAIDEAGNLNKTGARYLKVNNPPLSVQYATISSSSTNNVSSDTISCTATGEDWDRTETNKYFNATFRWYKNGTLYHTAFKQDVTIGDTSTATLNNSVLTEGEKWSCDSQWTDGIDYSNITTSRNLTILVNYTLTGCKDIIHGGSYTLITNITNSAYRNCMNISAKGVELYCNGNIIDGITTGNSVGVYTNTTTNGYLTNISISQCKITDWYYGIKLSHTNSSYIHHNNISTSGIGGVGIYLVNSDRNTISNINSSNGLYGINLYLSNKNNITDNLLSYSGAGLFLGSSMNNTVKNNTVRSNNDGINFADSEYNNIINNSFVNNDRGIWLEIPSYNNNFTQNNFYNNTIGLYLWTDDTPNFNTNIWNNIFNNTQNFEFSWFDPIVNYWNNTIITTTNIIGGPFVGGNYYSNYTGGIGFSDGCLNRDWDGICDIPYTIESLNIDELPLTYQVTANVSRDIVIQPTSAGTGSNLTCYFTVEDSDVQTLWVNLTWLLNSTVAKYNTTFTVTNGTNTSHVFQSANTTVSETWNCSITPWDGSNYGLPKSAAITITNTEADTPVVYINSTDGSNQTTQDLNCFGTISDPDGGNINATVEWKRNGVSLLTYDYNSSYASNTFFSAPLGKGNLSVGNNWSCGIRLTDGPTYGQYGYTIRNLTVLTNYSLTNCSDIYVSGSYTLQNNIPDTSIKYCMNVSVSNVELYCGGKTIDGIDSSSSAGFYSHGTNSNNLRNVSIFDCLITDFNRSVYYNLTQNSTIARVNATSSHDGFYLENSSRISAKYINSSINDRNGIYFLGTRYSNITNSTIYSNEDYGFQLISGSDYNIISYSIISNHSADSGIYLDTANYNQIINNTLENNSKGIYISMGTYNNFSTNRLTGNTRGIETRSASQYNRFWNNYVANPTNYFIQSNSDYYDLGGTVTQTNILGNATTGGNYWSSYYGPDANEDGIGDTSYILATNNVDNYPLVDHTNLANLTWCGTIDEPGTYYLSTDITNFDAGTCFTITSSNVTLNCQNNIVDGIDTGSTYGVYADGTVGSELRNVTVENCIIKDFAYGIFYEYTNYSDIRDNNISSSGGYGLYFNSGMHNNVYRINITNTAGSRAIYMLGSYRNNFSHMLIESNLGVGIALATSDYNVFTNNTITNHSGTNDYGINLVAGADYNTFKNNSITNNYAGLYTTTSSTYNNITLNNFEGNTFIGLRLNNVGDVGNMIWNNIFNNTNNYYVATGAVNFWNYTKISDTNIMGGNRIGGNYWHNYTNGPGYSDPCANLDWDSICDSAYYLESSNPDQLPLTTRVTANLSQLPLIQPQDPYTNSSLTCYFTISDTDSGDTIWANITWWNGTNQRINYSKTVTSGANSSFILGEANTSRGENWNCSITPWDQMNYGASSSNNVTIKNSAPFLIHTPQIQPEIPINTDNLTCYFTVQDIDVVDTLWVNLSWILNNSDSRYNTTFAVTNGTNTSHILQSANTSTADLWNCTITPWDGFDYGIQASDKVTLSNSAPGARYANLTPTAQGYGLNVSIKVNITDIDDQASIDDVWAEILTPYGTITNYSMTNIDSTMWQYNYSDWKNGTYFVKIFANDTTGNMNITNLTRFFIFFNATMQVRTMSDLYTGYDEQINLTDPPGGNDIGKIFGAVASANSNNFVVPEIVSNNNTNETILRDSTGAIESEFNKAKRKLKDNNENYKIIYSPLTSNSPTISNVYVDPKDVYPGDKMLVSADVSDDSGIVSVIANMPHEKGADTLNLNLVNGTIFNGTWQNTWDVHDTIEKAYSTTITAKNDLGKTSTANVGWTDALQWCYQETANASHGNDTADCGLSYTGNYKFYTDFPTNNRIYDGDWTSAISGIGSNFDINYSIPSGTNSALWQVKAYAAGSGDEVFTYCYNSTDNKYHQLYNFVGTQNVNITIPSACLQSKLRLRVTLQLAEINVMIYEEAMWWQVDVVAANVTMTEFLNQGQTTYIYDADISSDVNLSLILDDNVDGMIQFRSNVSINNTFNLDNAVEIGPASIFVNTTMYPALNTAANITMRNLHYANVTIKRDGSICTDCQIISYNPSTGTLVFNVTGFSEYTATEANQSKLQNYGPTNSSAHIYMRTDFWTGSAWTFDKKVYNGTAAAILNTSADYNLIKLDSLWNTLNFTTRNLTHGQGMYRVYVAAIAPDGTVLTSMGTNFLNATYNFTYDSIDLPEVATGPTITPSGATAQNNLTCTFTVEDLDPTDTLWVNLTWYLNSTVAKYNTTFQVTNGTTTSHIFQSTNLTFSESWNCSITPWDQTNYGTTESAVISLANIPPLTLSPNINSTSGQNKTTDNLTCSDRVSDPDGSPMHVTVRWFQYGVLNSTLDFNNSYANGTLFTAILQKGNLTVGNNWSCALRTWDGTNYSSFGHSANLTIINEAPTNPSPQINSTDGSNVTTQDLNCFATINDPGEDTLSVIVDWMRNGTSYYTTNYNNSYPSGTFFSAKLGKGNLTADQNLSCRMILYDGSAYSAWGYSRNLTVLTNYTISNCSDIKKAGSYTLANSIYDSTYTTCINITTSNVNLDCQGNLIDGVDGGSSTGAYLHGASIGSAITNASIKNCRLTDWNTGLNILYVNRSYFESINSSSMISMGVQITNSAHLKLDKLNLSKSDQGIVIGSTYYSNLTNLRVIENFQNGLNIYQSHHDIIQNSTFANHTSLVGGVGQGIILSGGNLVNDYHQFINNNISFNNIGISSHTPLPSNYTNFTGNTIYGNEVGIYIIATAGRAKMFYNNIINNTNNTFIAAGYGNNWSIGAITSGTNILGKNNIGGNYWGNYTNGTSHVDRCRNIDWDGICDSANYTIDSNNFDLFPLASHVTPNITISPVIQPNAPDGSQNLTCYFSVEDSDVGDTLWVNLTWYLNSTVAKYNATFQVTNGTNTSHIFQNTNTTVGDIWNCSVTPNDGYTYGTPRSSLTTIYNTAPNTLAPKINSTSGYNRSTDNLTCYDTVSDPDGDSVYMTVQWYQYGVLNNTIDYNSSYSHNTIFTAVLQSGNLTLGDNWSCAIRQYDGSSYGSYGYSNNLTIIDSTRPNIEWKNPTPANGYNSKENNTILNASISDETNTSAFFDWNYSLQAYYSFDYYNTSQALDNSSYKRHANYSTSLGTDAIVSGKYGRGIFFDGASDYLWSSDIDGSGTWTELTLEAWVNSGKTGQAATSIFGKRSGVTTNSYQLGFDGSGSSQLFCGIRTSAYAEVPYTVSPSLTTGRWYHVVCTYKSGEGIKLYLDGALLGTAAQTGAITDTSFPTLIGARWNDNTLERFLNGTLDEVKIYNRAIGWDEINSSMSSSRYNLEHNFSTLNSGEYNYSAYAIDSQGNLNTTAIRGLFVDTIKPIGIVQRNSTTIEFAKDMINVNWTITEANIHTIVFNISYPDGSRLFGSSATSGSINLSSQTNLSQKGHYTISLFVNDSANNINTTYSFFNVNDTIRPQIKWESPTPENSETVNVNNVYLNATINDPSNTSAFFDWNYSLRGYWNFEHVLSNGTIYDNSSFLNHGTLRNFAANTTVPGKYGKALDFDGIDSYVEISDSSSLDLTNKFSITLWMKPADLIRSNRYLVSKLNDGSNDNVYSVIWEYVNDNVEFYANGYTGDNPRTGSAISIPDTNWHHVVYTYDGTDWKGYRDGDIVFSQSRTFTLGASTGNLLLGDFNNLGHDFYGSIDEVAIFSRALSWNEINASYNNSRYRLENNFTSLSQGTYNYSAYAIDTSGNLNVSSRGVIISLDNSAPNITWIIPADLNISIFKINFTQNITIQDVNLYLYNCSIYSDLGLTLPVYSMQRDVTGSYYVEHKDQVNISTWSDGYYYEQCQVSDQ